VIVAKIYAKFAQVTKTVELVHVHQIKMMGVVLKDIVHILHHQMLVYLAQLMTTVEMVLVMKLKKLNVLLHISVQKKVPLIVVKNVQKIQIVKEDLVQKI